MPIWVRLLGICDRQSHCAVLVRVVPAQLTLLSPVVAAEDSSFPVLDLMALETELFDPVFSFLAWMFTFLDVALTCTDELFIRAPNKRNACLPQDLGVQILLLTSYLRRKKFQA